MSKTTKTSKSTKSAKATKVTQAKGSKVTQAKGSTRVSKAAKRGASGKASGAGQDKEFWHLRLYVAGQSPKSISAFANLKRLCDAHLPERYSIEVIDLMQQPQLAAGDQIVAIPTLVRKLPEPLRRIVGDLSNTEKALVGLQLLPANQPDGPGSR